MKMSQYISPVVGAEYLNNSNIYPNINRPMSIRSLFFKNRLFFPSFGVDLADSDGCFSADLHEFYKGIADSGCGFFLLGNSSVSPESILQPRGLRMHDESHAAAVAPFIEHCSRQGAVVGMQLQHYGAQAVTTHIRGKSLLSPSGISSPTFQRIDSNYAVKAMTQADIDVVTQQFIRAASLSYRVGVKMIQLQASNGYLLSSYLSPHTNVRMDEYGGTPMKRAKILQDIVRGIRREIGSDAVLSVRLGADDGIGEKGLMPKDLAEVIPMLEQSGLDMLEVSIGTAETSYNIGRTDEMMNKMAVVVRTIKKFATVPVGFAGLVANLSQAEQLISTGAADFVGMGRALFADNELIHKTLTGQEDKIFRCRWDGQCSRDKFNPNYSRIYCCVNPKYLRPT